jgi:hypothetical protein
MQPQAGGKPHPRLNTGERPIANKYREGKMKRTLRRESKALEIAGREALGARRFGPVRMSGGAGGRPRRMRELPFQGCLDVWRWRSFASPRPSWRDGQRRLHGRQGGEDWAGQGGGLASLSCCGPLRRPSSVGPRSKKIRASFGGQGSECSGGFRTGGGREPGAHLFGATSDISQP